MLYSKNILEIGWNDVVEFCNQRIQEGATLDYKKDFPNNLQKTIAAFANTMGGIILIGVDEDDENKPKLPVEGIKFERGISERIINIILSNITPPVFPEIQVCVNDDNSKAVAIIRVPQSNKTPHAINKNTEVYIRTGNRNNFEPLATVEKLFWLADNRNKSIILRKETLEDAKNRFDKFYNLELGEALKRGNFVFSPDVSRLTLTLSPCFPQEFLCSPPELRNVLNNIYIKDYYGTSDEFPIAESRFRNKLNQNGINLGLFINNYAYYTELSCFGIYYYRQHLFGRLESADKKPECSIRFNEIIVRLDQLFQSAEKFYTAIGFNGLLSFSFFIDGLKKFSLKIGIDGDSVTTLEDDVYYEETFMKNQLIVSKKELIYNAIRNLAWAYNWDMKMDYFNHFEKRFVAL